MKKYACLDGVDREPDFLSGVPGDFDCRITGVVEAGHGVASGKNPRSKYPQGTVVLQYPHFKELGLDIGKCYPGTLNLSISPAKFKITNPEFHLKEVRWYEQRPTEDFMICSCLIGRPEEFQAGYIYCPDPATKVEYFDNPSALQIVAPFIPGGGYGEKLEVFFRSGEMELSTL